MLANGAMHTEKAEPRMAQKTLRDNLRLRTPAVATGLQARLLGVSGGGPVATLSWRCP